MAIVSSKDFERELLKTNKTYNNRLKWSELYSATDLAAQQAESSVKQSYANDIAEAFKASQGELSSLYGSGMISGMKQDYANDISDAMKVAYDTYTANYNKNVQSVIDSYTERKANITSSLQAESQYGADYINKTVDYLKWLDENLQDEGARELISKYYVDGVVMDENQLNNILYNDGMLTRQGVEFFDIMNNAMANYAPGYSYGQFLKQTDEDLYNWATTGDLSSVLNAMGIKDLGFSATDAKLMYSTDFELENMFNELDSLELNIEDKESYQQFVDKYNEFASSYGLDKLPDYDRYDRIGELQDELNEVLENISAIDSDTTSSSDKKQLEKLYTKKDKLSRDISDAYDAMQANIKNAKNLIISQAKQKRDDYWSSRQDASTISTDFSGNFYTTDTDSAGNDKPTKKISSTGERVSLVKGVTKKGSSVKDKAWDNFKLEYDGKTYKVETTKDILEDNVKYEVTDLIRKSEGREPVEGDVIEYKGNLYVVDASGNFRGIKSRVDSSSQYRDLYKAITNNV